MTQRKLKLHVALSLAVLTVFLISGAFSPLFCTAESDISRIEKKIKIKKHRAKKIREELEDRKKKIRETIRAEKSILSKIDNLENSITQTKRELARLNERISRTQTRIISLSKEISQLASKLEKREIYLKKRLRHLYKQQYGDRVLILVSANDNQDLIRKSRYLSILAFQDSRIMKKYRNDMDEIEIKKSKVEILQAKLRNSIKRVSMKKAELEKDRIKKDRLLSTVRSKRETYEKTVRELEESSRELQKMIKALEKQKIPESVTGKGFRAFRGHLEWPVNGKVLIPYGKYTDPKFNITVFKNGIEISSKTGAMPRAVANGKVVYADWFKGYGLLLIINHGNGYHSLYGNLSEIFNKTGDIINRGAVVGKVGTSRLLDVPTLYFEIRYKGKPINPLQWLKRKNRRPRRYK